VLWERALATCTMNCAQQVVTCETSVHAATTARQAQKPDI